MSNDTSSPLSAEGVSALASFIIRPPRAQYSRRALGRRRFLANSPRSVPVTRTDIQLQNPRGQTLQCSHYIPMIDAHSASARPGISDATANSSTGDNASSGKTLAAMPAVVYLHGNGSCRVEAEVLFDHILPYGMSVFSLDFSGSGKSDGEYISLGVFEKHDVETVVNYLSDCEHVSSIALWGHSMGAATATMYAGLVDPSCSDKWTQEHGPLNGVSNTPRAFPRPMSLSFINSSEKANRRRSANMASNGQRASVDICGSTGKMGTTTQSDPTMTATKPSFSGSQYLARENSSASQRDSGRGRRFNSAKIKALVLDSAFASFEKLAVAMVETMPLPAAIPRRLILSVGVRAVRKSVKDKAGFDVYDIDPLSACRKICPDMPTIMLQGTKDEIVHVSHAKLLFAAYPGRDKRLVIMEGIEHDSPRPTSAIEKAFVLLQRSLFDDNGIYSLRYINAVKLRGNDAMVEGRFTDAIFLYANALNALVAQDRELSNKGDSSLLSPATEPVGKTEPTQNLDGDISSNIVKSHSRTRKNGNDSDDTDAWPASDDDESRRRSTRARAKKFASSKWIPSRVTEALSGLTRKGSGVNRSSDTVKHRERSGRRKFLRSDLEADAAPGSSETSIASRQEATLSTHGRRNASGDEDTKVPDASASTTRKRSRFSGVLPRQRLSFSNRGVHRSSGPSPSAPLSGLEDSEADADPAACISKTNSGLINDKSENKFSAVEFIRVHGVSKERSDLALALLGNRSLARLRLKDNVGALADAELALQLDKKWIRGYQRKACALKHMNKLEEARICIEEGLRIAPSSATLLDMRADVASAVAFKVREARKNESKVVQDEVPATQNNLKPPSLTSDTYGEQSTQNENVRFIVKSDDDETEDSDAADPALGDRHVEMGRPVIHEKIATCDITPTREGADSAVF